MKKMLEFGIETLELNRADFSEGLSSRTVGKYFAATNASYATSFKRHIDGNTP